MISESLTLIRMDLLKLWRRRGLIGIALLLAVGSVGVIFAVQAIRHGTNPQHVGPAGGIKNFEDATDFLGMIAVVVAAMIGATAGAGEAELGVLRDMLATGRSRAALFGSRAVSAVLVTVAILAAGLVVATACSVALAGSTPLPSLSEIVQRDLAVLAFAASAALVSTGVASFARSRGAVMASVIAFGVLISQLLLNISFLGNLRDLLPLAAFERMAGDTISGLSIPLPVAIAVAAGWALAALGAGSWWARRVEV
jgi:ABC-type transport system involved in multi-copper enzyme maturation permease subunit